MDDYRIDFAAVPWQSPLAGVRAKTVARHPRQLRLVEYTPAMEPHWCQKGHAGYILDGQFEIRFPQETIVFHPGDGVFIPPGFDHRHMARALTDVVRAIFVEDV